MNRATIVYHKNVYSVYPKQWVEEFKNSILNQTKGTDLYELNYGNGEERIFENSNYEREGFPTFVHAMNYLLDSLFSVGYDCVFNTNSDDRYAPNRVEKQLEYMQHGYDLVSSNFALLNESGEVYHYHKFSQLDIREELHKDHNVVAHPAVCYSSRFWRNNRYIPDEIPYEDLRLWQRAITNYKFAIAPENLLFHRVHSNSVCQSENR